MRWMRRVMENAVERQPELAGGFSCNITTRIAVAVKPREVAAGNLQADAMARYEHIRRGPQVEPEFVDRLWFEQLSRRE